MAGFGNSRYRHINRFRFSQGVFSDLRERLAFKDRKDNRGYTVKEGDNLLNISFRFFPSFDRPAGLWWIIAEYNSIHDPTQNLEPGKLLVIPSEIVAANFLSTIPKGFIQDIQDLPA